MIVRGTNKGREGKVSSVYRLKFALHVAGSTQPRALRILKRLANPRNSRPREEQRSIRPHPHRRLQGRRHKAQAR